MKKLFKFFFLLILLFGLERFIRSQTEGFRIDKIFADFDPNPKWELPEQAPPQELLHQSFYFLGSGVQCYAFLSEDGETVLKVFKHYHLPPNSRFLRRISVPAFLGNWKNAVLSKREERMQSIFSSALIAYRDLKEHTGVFFLNLNPKLDHFPKVSIYDKIGIHYELDLNKTPFLLQKKADLLFSYLESHKDETKNVIDSLFSCIQYRNQRGIINNDPLIHRNFGILNGEVIEIDVGSFVSNPYLKKSFFSKREFFFETLKLKEWILENRPEYSEYFDQKLLQAIRT